MSPEHLLAKQNRAAFTVAEFCEAHRLSRSYLYKIWAAGTGPRIMRVGSKVLISIEAAEDWRRARSRSCRSRRGKNIRELSSPATAKRKRLLSSVVAGGATITSFFHDRRSCGTPSRRPSYGLPMDRSRRSRRAQSQRGRPYR